MDGFVQASFGVVTNRPCYRCQRQFCQGRVDVKVKSARHVPIDKSAKVMLIKNDGCGLIQAPKPGACRQKSEKDRDSVVLCPTAGACHIFPHQAAIF